MIAMMSLRDRRSFAVLSHLAAATGTGVLLLKTDDPTVGAQFAALDETRRATALVSEAETEIVVGIGQACDYNTRLERRIWKAVAPDTGARASGFLAHAQTTLHRRSDFFDVGRQDAARDLLSTYFPLSAEDDEALDDVLGTWDETQDLGAARMAVMFWTLSLLVGPDATRQLPGFPPYATPEYVIASMAWDSYWARTSRQWLAITDPDGLAAWRDAQQSAQ